MIFDWYKVFNLDEFLAEQITSREMILLLESIGRTVLLISRGNLVSISFNDVFLPVNFSGDEPYVDSGYASYLDEDNNVWFGVEVSA